MKILFKLLGLWCITHAVHADVIYSVNQIPGKYKTVHYPAYVQMGSFSTADAAKRLQQHVRARTNVPVRIQATHGRYKVMAGPFRNPSALKAFGGRMAHTNHNAQSTFAFNFKPMLTIQPVHFDYFNKLHPHPEVSVLLGGSYISNAINRQTLQLLPYEVGEFADRFTNQSDAGAFTWGVDAKYRFNLHSPSRQEYAFDSFGAGLAVYQITNFNQTGEVQQFNLIAFDNYTYTLNLQTTRILANFDLNFHPLYNHFIPFMEGGFGGASTVMSYTSKPIDPVASPTFNLPNQTSWRFAYQVGTGIKYRPKNNLECSIHYLYANMGTANSSITGNSSTLATPLKANMSAQNFLLGLTYLMK